MGRDAILFLDDSPERAALAYQRMTPEDANHTIWCKSAEEAISVLKDYATRLKKVYLDHDLGGEGEEVPMHSGNENSGMEVVRYLEKIEPATFYGCLFIVHSYNSFAGPRMSERLTHAGYSSKYEPFGLGKL